MPYNRRVSLVRDGEQVKAGTPNRPLGQLAQNTDYLLSLIDAASLGATVFARSVSVEAGAAVGMPVYYNTATARFERALARASIEEADGFVATADSAQVVGVVYLKHNSTLADLLLYGWTELDISAAAGDGAADGPYYLSGATAGALLVQRPPVSVRVLLKAGEKVFVNPQVADFVDRHVHYQFDLTCQPAGDHAAPAVDERHVITNADDSLTGWLPADHASFAGLAPAGASFGYNLAADAALAEAWPPLPLAAAWVEWNKGLSKDVGFTGVPLGEQGLLVLDRNGIWWMSDCYGDVPWPTEFDSTNSLSESESLDECPRDLSMQMRLSFSRASFAADQSVVESLTSLDERLIVRCSNGDAGSRGALVIDLDLGLSVADEPATGHEVLKTFDGEQFTAGPVVEGLFAASDNVIMTSTDPLDVDGDTLHRGRVQLAVLTNTSRLLDVSEVRLDGAGQEFFQDVMYLGFPAEQENSYRGRIDVPADSEVPSPTLALRLRLLGRAAGTLPALDVTARIVPRPASGLDTPADLPLSAAEFAVTIDTVATLDSANQYVEALSEAFAVTAGDQVFFTVRRNDDDAYAGEVGVLHHEGVLEAGE